MEEDVDSLTTGMQDVDSQNIGENGDTIIQDGDSAHTDMDPAIAMTLHMQELRQRPEWLTAERHMQQGNEDMAMAIHLQQQEGVAVAADSPDVNSCNYTNSIEEREQVSRQQPASRSQPPAALEQDQYLVGIPPSNPYPSLADAGPDPNPVKKRGRYI
jgi:hypothetical protein